MSENYISSSGVKKLLGKQTNFLRYERIMAKLYHGSTLLIEDFKDKITNCITEIPQDIKYTISGNTFTLLAGSKVYFPNGSGVFEEYILSSNITATTSTGNRYSLFFVNNTKTSFGRMPINQCFSGTPAPSDYANMIWYDTDNNIIKSTSNSGSTWGGAYSLPIVVCHENGNEASIEQVFNGFGYIGSTVFALPGVKGLIPNGRNADGTLKNIEITSSQVWTRTWQGNPNYNDLSLASSGIGINTNPYNEEENFVYNANGVKVIDRVVFGRMEYNSSSPWNVTKLLVKTAFHAVDYNDFSDLKNSIPTVNNATLTITQGGTTKGTFTANASSNVTIDLDSGGGNLKNRLFDVVEKDHELTDDESAGYAKLGTYVYKNAFGNALGYPDFVDQAITEYNESLTNVKYGYKSSNINLEGAVTEVDGFIQGFFGTVSYATFPAKTPATSFELVIKHRTPLLSTTLSILESTTQYKGIILRNINASTGQINIWIGTGSAWTISNVNTNCPVVADVWNWHKIVWDGTTLTVSVSQDGINYTTGLSQALALAPDWNTALTQSIGGSAWEDYAYLNGEVDLNECYLDIDGERYWTGVNKYKYYENTSGKLFYDIADKADIDTVFDKTHSAWLYGIDEVNNRVFLPRNIERKLVKSQEPTGALKAWYNLYSDGWCEQGALVSAVDANWRDRKISFVIPFNNIGYDLHIQTAHTTNTDASPINEKTETYFGCKAYNSTGNATWSAAGYTDFTTPDYRYMIVGSNAPQSQTIEVLDITSSENDTVPLGYCVYQNSEAQSNSAWLKSNGMWHTKIQYPTFYSYLMANIGTNNIVDSTTTITDDTDKFIIDQTTETFKLPIRTGERRLVYTYTDGTEWINWYSDGWCEQGGICKSHQYNTNLQQVTFIIPYIDTNYTAMTCAGTTTEEIWQIATRIAVKTTTGLDIRGGTNANGAYTGDAAWKTSGYAAIPQLSDYNVSESLYVKVSNAVQNLQLLDVGTLMNYLKTFEVVDDLPENQLSNVFYFCKNFQD